jgi:purine-binding chemotaxis protein CheW
MMSLTTQQSRAAVSGQTQLATFYLGELCLAVEIEQIQEITRGVNITRVPDAPPEVSGVINLRGEVATIIDLRRVLGLPPADASKTARTLIVRSQDESIGLQVDRVADITTVEDSEILPAPPNVGRVDGRFIRGVCPRETEILVVLDLEEVLSSRPTSTHGV